MVDRINRMKLDCFKSGFQFFSLKFSFFFEYSDENHTNAGI